MKNLETMRALYDAFDRGDIATVISYLDPLVEWVEPDVEEFPYQGLTVGRDAVADEVLATIPTVYRRLDFHGENRWIEGGDTVVVLGTGQAAGLSGRVEEFRFNHVWTLRDGLVVRFDGFADTHKLRQAIAGRT